jgi:DNA (cytosine-5)-methyltransferase 1
VKHLGDITLIRGDEIEPADCIIGGSPCQDLSVAGKRAGLSGARSGLFMEQIRIVKEMRKKYGKPRYMVWENVPGAFSSNRGEDFRIVLEEIVKVVDESATVPQPPKGRWAHAGCVVGDGYSVAWRVHDAQFWGVPQRRRRIALIADFGGESAPEILFERDSVSGDSEAGREAREGAAGTAPSCIGITNRGSVAGVVSETLRSGSHGALPMVAKMYALDAVSSNGIDRADTAGCNGRGWRENVSYTLNTIDRPAVCYDMAHASDVIRDCGEVSPTLQSRMGTGGNQIPLTFSNQGFGGMVESDVASTQCSNQCKLSSLDLSVQDGVVRRLTPLECERLQGFPDGWTDIGDWIDTKGKKHKSADAPRYKALGNSIALPFWLWMLRRMSEYLPAGATMGSLFDGIGGFPLCWETVHGKGKARWASEIEEFPIAVTKMRFPEDE